MADSWSTISWSHFVSLMQWWCIIRYLLHKERTTKKKYFICALGNLKTTKMSYTYIMSPILNFQVCGPFGICSTRGGFRTCLSTNLIILKISFWKLELSKIFFTFFHKIGIGSMRFFVLENFSISKNNIIDAQVGKALWLFMYSRMRVNQSNLAKEPGGFLTRLSTLGHSLRPTVLVEG